MLQVHVCNPFTGDRIDGFNISRHSYSNLLSARGSATLSIPLTSKQTSAFLRPYLEPWQYILVIEEDGVPKFGGYPIPGSYRRGVHAVQIELGDLWALLARRIMTAAGVNVVQWSTTLTGSRAEHAATLIALNRDRGILPNPTFPLVIPGAFPGVNVTRAYRGYEMTYVYDKVASLMDEGLDVFFRPQWTAPGQFGWLMEAGDGWGTGVVREFCVTAKRAEVTEFEENTDGSRVTNNSDRVGEGSEVDLLVESQEDSTSPLPLLERITMSKSVSDRTQLLALAGQDVITFREPTVQWDFKVTADTEINVGDTARMIFYGDPWVPDGIYLRRVVKISGDTSEQISVSVQPTGGA